jgi:acetylglutamate synthase
MAGGRCSNSQEFELPKLQQLVNKAVQQQPDSIQQYKVTGDCLKQQTEMIQEDVDSASCLLEIQIQRVEESIVENGKPNTQIQALNKNLGELQETNVRVEESIVENGKPNTQIQELIKNFESYRRQMLN